MEEPHRRPEYEGSERDLLIEISDHHAVSPKWLQGYLNEYVWRYNHRDDGRAMFLSLILRAALG